MPKNKHQRGKEDALVYEARLIMQRDVGICLSAIRNRLAAIIRKSIVSTGAGAMNFAN